MTDGDRITLDRISLELSGTQDLNLKHLYYFHTVATTGTIARAARKLGLGAATISEQLKNLEEYLGQPLLERRSTGVRLNQQGRRVFEHTSAMFRVVHRMLQDVSPERCLERWTLEVGVCPTISRTLAVRRFLPLFDLESVVLRVRQESYENLMDSLMSGDLDLVISENLPTEVEQKKVGTRVLAESPLVFVASKERAAAVERYPYDLGSIPLINYPPSSRYRREVDSFLVENGLAPAVLAEVDDVMLMLAAAEAGASAAAVPESVTADGVERGSLTVLGKVNGSSSRVYAHFQSVKTPDVVMKAVEALAHDA